MNYSVILTKPFKKSVKRLKKKYPRVQQDVKLAVETLLEMPTLGRVIIGSNGIRKLRIRNQDAQRGKSGGYRLLYYFEDHANKTIYLLLLFSKSERDDVTRRELEGLLEEISAES